MELDIAFFMPLTELGNLESTKKDQISLSHQDTSENLRDQIFGWYKSAKLYWIKIYIS